MHFQKHYEVNVVRIFFIVARLPMLPDQYSSTGSGNLGSNKEIQPRCTHKVCCLVAWTLGIFRLFDVLNHLAVEAVAVVVILCDQRLHDEP